MRHKDYIKFEFLTTLYDFEFVYEAIQRFLHQLNPSENELKEVKAAVSEAVDNVCMHAYSNGEGPVKICCRIVKPYVLKVTINDNGVGIDDVEAAMELLATSNADMCGLGFSIMQAAVDKMKVRSIPGKGTTVCLRKTINGK